MSDVAITKAVTQKIAKLAKLKLTDAEVEKYTTSLEQILNYVKQLGEVNTDGIEPLVHGIVFKGDHLRDDVAKPLSEEQIQKILGCSEQVLYDQYKVPQVIGEA